MMFVDKAPPAAQPDAGDIAASGLLSRLTILRASTIRLVLRRLPALEPMFTQKRASSISGRLVPVINDLELLSQSTEQDFLKTGERLARLIASTQAIRGLLESLADIMSGESVERSISALARVLAHSVSMTAASSEHSSRIHAMRKTLAPLKQQLASFEVTITLFRTMAVLIRIETSRLSDSGSAFETLANDMSLLATSLDARVKNSLAIADSFLAPIDSAMLELATIATDQAATLPSLISGISGQLSSFTAKLQDARDLSSTLGSRYEAIAAHFRQVIVALQIHDTTRQQVEHVVQALRHLVEQPSNPNETVKTFGAGPCFEAGSSRSRAFILDLQHAQLDHTREKFSAAVAAIMQSLDQVAMHIRKLSEDSEELVKLSGDTDQNFLGNVEQGYAAVFAGLQQCENASSTTAKAEVLLQEAIGSIRKPLQEIQFFELQILKLALNATICAAHAGDAGNCLAVLATSVQQLALDSREKSDSILAGLSSAASLSTCISKVESSLDISDPSSTEDWMEDLRTGVSDLHLTGRQSAAAVVTSIATSGKRILGELEATCRDFRAGPVFAESARRAQQVIRSISAEALADAASSGETLEADPGPDQYYTMQSERDVHDAFLSAKTASPAYTPGDLQDEIAVESGIEFF